MLVSSIPLAVSASGADGPSIELRIMTFNIFYVGDEVDLDTLHWTMNSDGN
ncbi:MAG: hypothetical protein JW880_04150 [Candidatus Thermoplasmatota archaeon]|nr:hypothetical protein [Candidatus Thermoplasmatota archaeon]